MAPPSRCVADGLPGLGRANPHAPLRTVLVVLWLITLATWWGAANAAQPPSSGLLWETWQGIPGASVFDLLGSPDYPDRPTTSEYVTDLFETPTDILDEYGSRLHGYIVPPKTGDYTFWLASDDGGALYLSPDEDPAKAQEIATVNSWTSSREWTREENQRSAPIPLVAGRVYYISALMKEAWGGDNLAVRWLWPDGTDQAPIVATNLLPYGIVFTAPVITGQPTSTTVVEGDTARFLVRLASVGVYHYQWQRNGKVLSGATGPELVFGPVNMADQNSRFRCVVSNTLGSATSTEAILTVTPDVTPPALVAALNLGLMQVEVTFSERVVAPSATTATNYRLSGGVAVTAAALGATPNVIVPTTSSLTLGTTYTLTVDGVQDAAANPNPVPPESQIQFLAVDYAPRDIGAPPLAGSATPVTGGVDVTGSGDLSGSSDAFHFAWQRRTGDFDVRARLADFDPTDPFAKAGLMARETLDPSSRYAAAVATPATVGCFFMARSAGGAVAQRSGYLPANYPETWLRLKRAGNRFTGYAGHDGEAWVELGAVQLALPTTIYFGLAASSRNSQQPSLAEFRDIAPVVASTTTTYAARGERLGPSSRQTPLVFSEIMYHPLERADGRTAEFIEVYNADLIAQDLTGYRIGGSVAFAFPAGFVLPAGGFAVVARDPAEFAAIHGAAGALGPFAGTNSLPNDAGTLRLFNPRGAILLEVDYRADAPWPVAADGAGHSLVLARPSCGEGDPRAWAASERIGGSPGEMESVRPDSTRAVLINEFLAHTDDPELDFVELYNHSNAAVDVGGCVLTDTPAAARFRIPDGVSIPARGFLAFDQNQLGFRLNAAGESLFLINSNLTRVIDAVRYGAQERGVATGRYPDGTPELRRLTAPSPAAANRSFRVSEVVINELMYNPISGDSDDEFVELHNRTTQAVELAGWRLTDGIDFEFPAGATLAAGGYVVVARNQPRLQANHPALDSDLVFGDYDGTLANGGERVALAKPDLIVVTNAFGLRETNRIFIEIDEVTYQTGGRWGRWSDGLGSSLELIDPQSDHRRPSNWADSDETAKAPWGTIEVTGRLDHSDGGSANRLQIMLQGAGECLVDNLEVLPVTGGNRLGNPGFESGLDGWEVQGNHRTSTVDNGVGLNNSRALHLRAAGRGDTACNRIYTPFGPELSLGANGTLRARVRWLKGWPEFLLRLRGSSLEAAGRMPLPANLGTPGQRNSRAIANAGPALVDVAHSPILPAANQAILVTARPTDPDGVAAVRLKYRIDPGGSTTTVSMKDGGTGGDLVGGDGVFSGAIPAQPAGLSIAFHVEATDNRATGAATSVFPADAPNRECLVRWGDTQPVGNLGVYRLWQRQAEYDWLRNREPLANDNLDCTFVYDDGRVIYNAEMRAKGSPWHGGSVGTDYLFAFPADDRFLGARDVALVTVGNLGNDDSVQREQAAFWIGRQMGLPTLHRRHVFFFENGAQKQQIYEDTEEPNGLYADRWWPEGQDGDLYKVEDWFEFDDGGYGFTSSRDATLEQFTTTGGAYKLARYRWAWRKRAVTDSANDYTNLFNLVTAVNAADASLVPQVENLVDVDNWMGIFALQHIVGNWDAYGYDRGKNTYIYKPRNGRFGMIPWDIDFVLGSGSNGTGTDIFGCNDPTISRLWENPTLRRAYLRAYLNAIAGPLQSAAFDPIVDGRYAGLTANGLVIADPRAIKTWVSQRRTWLANRIAGFDTRTFAITTNNGNDVSTDQVRVTLTGYAPIAIATLEVNGTVLPVTWISVTAWSATIALGGRTNLLSLVGYDSKGNPYPGATDTITIRYTGAELPSPAGQVVINEIQYHPLVPGAAFVEILNASSSASFDLSGWRLDGVGFEFPSGLVLAPGATAVVVADRDAFAAAYGFGVLPVGAFTGTLQNDGERLRLIKPGATPAADVLVDEVRYADTPPWPVQADGHGPSLQLVDPLQDNWRAANWAAANPGDAVQATPGKPNSVANPLPPFPLLFLNEVQPQNLAGPTDRFGDRDPWIELHNPGPASLDLGGLYLAGEYANLMAWPFPAGTRLDANDYLLVWADGEPGESTTGELHTSFRLAPTNGSVALVRLQLGAPAVLDHLDYHQLSPGLSLGSYPDGQPQERRLFHLPTPEAPNNPATPPVQVFINEWLASNTGVVLDPADQDSDDWFELYNAGPQPVDLSAFTLTDVPSDPAKYVIPNGTTIPAGGYLIVWADEETRQSTNGQLHANFKLSGTGETIALHTPDGRPVDTVAFGSQTNNVSEGRFPDAMAEPFVFMGRPTPGAPNDFATLNRPPVLDPIGNRTTDEGQPVAFTAKAADADPDQHLTFTLFGAPTGATIDPQTGAFSWPTTEADGPADYTFAVRVTDDGLPPRWDAETITVTVRELNEPPTLDPLPDRSVDEGAELAFQVSARDPDLPAQRLRFSLQGAVPDGAVVNELTGEFRWIPAEDDGPGAHSFTVRVSDDGQSPLSADRTFVVTVNEVDNPPVFAPVSLQLTEELGPFGLTVIARDPDVQAHPLRYSLEAAPAGLLVNPATGQLTWTPDESQGPNSYSILVRATEVGGVQSSTLSFSIVVSEKNQPPSLSPIADQTVQEGTTLTFTSQAWDTDLPNQSLHFSLDPGAPPDASLNPQTGLFHWPIGADVGPSTNRITVRVTDDALVPQSASQTFTVIVQPILRVVINEIMYRPAPGGAEFVELHNTSTNTTWRLDRWRLTGTDYEFPVGSSLAPGAFLAIARNLTSFRTAYGDTVPVVGDYVSQLAVEGGTIQLLRPVGDGEELVDRVTFLARAPWPALANGGGPSLQLIDPVQDNERVGNWAATPGNLTNPPVAVLPVTAVWRYWQQESDPNPSWTGRNYDDNVWPSGGGLLYVEPDDLPAPKTTRLTLGRMSYLFRTRFQFHGDPHGASLELNTVLDDGAVFYLNDRAFFWLGMEEGVLPDRSTPANRTVGNAIDEGPFLRPVDNLAIGENVLAVEVHQTSAGSSDIVFGVSVSVVEAKRAAATPGAANSVRAVLEPFPQLRLNEVLANNQAGLRDRAGDRDPWLELVNAGADDAVLDGYFLANNYTNLAQWAFPAQTAVAPSEYRLVWVDGEPNEATAAEWHANFRLASPTGMVVLSRLQHGQPVVVDFLEYAGLPADRSFGYEEPHSSDAGPTLLPRTTPSESNWPAPPPPPQFLGIAIDAMGQVTLQWTAVVNRTYRIEATSDLALGSWQALGTVVAQTPQPAFTDATALGADQRYYRLTVLP